MDYVDFQIINDEIVCTGVYGGKKVKLSSENTKNCFKVLSENNYEYNELVIHGIKTVRFYNVSKSFIDSIKNNKKKLPRKVKRVNKYAGIKSIVSGTLSLILVLNSLGLYSENKSDKKLSKLNNSVVLDQSDKISIIESPYVVEEKNIILDGIFDFRYEDRSNSDKAILTRNLYNAVVTKYSNMYGLPSNLMLAVGTQERGTHSTKASPGGGFGLFQIQVENGWNWVGKSITAYNFELGQLETIVVCQKEDGSIDVNMLADLEYNTKVACMIMAYDLAYCDYDIIAALQTYNSGTGVVSLKEKYGDDWVNYRENLPGDSEYIEHVLSYILEDDSLLKYKDLNGKDYFVDINNVYASSLNKTR